MNCIRFVRYHLWQPSIETTVTVLSLGGSEEGCRCRKSEAWSQIPSTGLRHPSFGGRCRKAMLGVWLGACLQSCPPFDPKSLPKFTVSTALLVSKQRLSWAEMPLAVSTRDPPLPLNPQRVPVWPWRVHSDPGVSSKRGVGRSWHVWGGLWSIDTPGHRGSDRRDLKKREKFWGLSRRAVS